MLVFQDITGSLAINWPGSDDSTDDRSNIHRKHDQLQPICLFVVNAHAAYTLVGWMDEMIIAIQFHDNEDSQPWGVLLQGFSIPLLVCLLSVMEKVTNLRQKRSERQSWNDWNLQTWCPRKPKSKALALRREKGDISRTLADLRGYWSDMRGLKPINDSKQRPTFNQLLSIYRRPCADNNFATRRIELPIDVETIWRVSINPWTIYHPRTRLTQWSLHYLWALLQSCPISKLGPSLLSVSVLSDQMHRPKFTKNPNEREKAIHKAQTRIARYSLGKMSTTLLCRTTSH